LTDDKNKKKHRVPFRKNRSKRTRAEGKIDVRSVDDNLDSMRKEERVSGKSDFSRWRTVVGVEANPESGYVILRDIDLETCKPGRVLHAIGSNQCAIQMDDGRLLSCTVRRVLRTIAHDARNAVVTGDRVMVLPHDDKTGVIERVEPRSQCLARTSNRKQHIIAANVDQVVIVASADNPPFKPALIDRFLVVAGKNGITPIIVVNKIDLMHDRAYLDPILNEYRTLGYKVIESSVSDHIGIDELRDTLGSKITAFTGQSGVGKSSILNSVQPNLTLKIGDVSVESQKGRHTTRTSTLIPLIFGGWVIDTPGIRQLELWDLEPFEVEAYFVEFQEHLPSCKFPDCSHTHETSCAVKKAVEDGLISSRRYDSYLRIMAGQDETQMAAQRWNRNLFPDILSEEEQEAELEDHISYPAQLGDEFEDDDSEEE
jgi:ribosome biogenesis GTPase